MDKTSKYVWMNGKIVTYDKAVVPIMSHTPHYSSSILGGITRESVINISKYAGHPVIERNTARDE